MNPGRASSSGVAVKDGRVVLSGAHASAIFLSNGCVAACNLVVPGTNGTGMNTHSVKKIGIWPINEEFDALAGYFGAVYGVDAFYTHFFADILTFQTMKEGAGSSRSQCMFLHASF